MSCYGHNVLLCCYDQPLSHLALRALGFIFPNNLSKCCVMFLCFTWNGRGPVLPVVKPWAFDDGWWDQRFDKLPGFAVWRLVCTWGLGETGGFLLPITLSDSALFSCGDCSWQLRLGPTRGGGKKPGWVLSLFALCSLPFDFGPTGTSDIAVGWDIRFSGLGLGAIGGGDNAFPDEEGFALEDGVPCPVDEFWETAVEAPPTNEPTVTLFAPGKGGVSNVFVKSFASCCDLT